MDWQFKNWLMIGPKISWKLSFYDTMSFFYFFPRLKSQFLYSYVKKKHLYILNKLDFLNHAIEATDFTSASISKVKKIWFMWWQGKSDMPPVVQLCYSSVMKNANGAEVVFLDKNNYEDFIQVAPEVKDAYLAQKMPLAAFADYIRVSLIYQFGGLWLDATILVSDKIPDNCFSSVLYTLHTKPNKSPYVSDNRIHCYVLGGLKGSPLFGYVKYGIEEYWKHNTMLIDYYLLDYIIMYGYFNHRFIRNCIDSLSYTSESLYDIFALLNEPMDESRIKELLKENLFSKLSWKTEIINGENNTYAYLTGLFK